MKAIFAVIVLVFCVGWVVNIYRALNCDFEAPYKCDAIRIIGIFVPPVGGVVGYIDIEDGD